MLNLGGSHRVFLCVQRVDFRKAHDDPVPSKQAVDRIRALFKIEESAKDLTDEARALLRRELARPLLTEFRAWLDLAETQVLPKSPLGKAIGYALDQWPALLR